METKHCPTYLELFPPAARMRLYFRDTGLSYREISELLTRNIGPAGVDTWQNGAENSHRGFLGYVDIYADSPGRSLVALAWR